MIKLTIPMRNQNPTQRAVFNMFAPADQNWIETFEHEVGERFIHRFGCLIMAERAESFPKKIIHKWDVAHCRHIRKQLRW